MGFVLPDPLPMVKARRITRECGSEGRRERWPLGAGLSLGCLGRGDRAEQRAQPGNRDLDHHCQRNTINTSIIVQFVRKVVKESGIDFKLGVVTRYFPFKIYVMYSVMANLTRWNLKESHATGTGFLLFLASTQGGAEGGGGCNSSDEGRYCVTG